MVNCSACFPHSPGLRVNLGLALHAGGRYWEAIRHFRVVLKEQPDNGPAWLMLGLAHLKLGEPAKAIVPLERAVRAEPNNKIARLELADTCLVLGRPEDAAAHFLELTQLDPQNPKAWQGLGLSYLSLSRRAFEELEQIAPDSSYCYVLLARSLATRNQNHAAFNFYRQALAKDPELRGIHEGLAEVYRKTGHPDWAATVEERLRQLPEADCATQKLECEYLAGHYDAILEVAKTQKTSSSFYWQARAYSELGLEALARLSQLPPSAAVHELMAQAYHIQERHDLAIQEWQGALEREPQSRRLQKGWARALWLNRCWRSF